MHTFILALLVGAVGVACGKVNTSADAGSSADAAGSNDGAVVPDGAPGTPDAAPDAPDLSVAPLATEFGPVKLNQVSSAVSFTFSNNGGGDATGCAAPALSGANAGDFAIASDSCGTANLVAGGKCTVNVTVKPSAVGIRTATLSRTCSVGGVVTTTANGLAVNRPMYVFISSVSYTGDLGGLAGADAKCNALAAAGSLSKTLNKQWKALLSKSTGGVVNAKDRFVWTGPMFDLKNNPVTADPSSWPWTPPVGASVSAIDINESGGPPDDSYSWSGSTIDGVSKGAALDCNGWTDTTNSFKAQAGETANYPSASWFDSFTNTCESQWFGIYCVSQEKP